jgi:Ca2+-binding RTX toxin-like protein
VIGGVGGDNISGNSGANVIDGAVGNDVIDGGSGNDVIYGGEGLDLLFGGAGNDMVNAGNGDDIIGNGDGRGNDTFDGGQGVDIVRYGSAVSSIIVALAEGQTAGTASGTDIGSDLLLNIENVIGGAGADNITGNSARNAIDGGAGNDIICGTQRVVNGGRGQIDTLTGGVGADIFVIGGVTAGRFYDDGAIGAGRNDYALVTDFTVGQDRIQLKGTASQYFLGASGVNGVSGSGVYFDSNSNRSLDANDELLAIVRSGNNTALNVGNTVNTANFV